MPEQEEKQKRQNASFNMTEGPISDHLRRMAIPMVWGILAMIVSGLADIYYIAQLGTSQLAAITFTFPVTQFFANIVLGLGVGVGSVISRAVGEGGLDKVRRLSMHAFLLSFLIVAVATVIGLLTVDPLFGFLGAEGEAMGHVHDYMVIWYWGTIFLIVPMTGNFILRGLGDARMAGITMVMGSLFTIILDPILIFGWGPIPRLEMEGAAYATIFARIFGFSVMVVILIRRRILIRKSFSLSRMDRSWSEILKVGGPTALTNTIMPLSAALATALIAQSGPAVIGAFGVATRIEMLAMIPMMAVASIMGPVVGQNYGAELHSRVAGAIIRSGQFFVGYGLFISIVLAIGAPYFIGVFDSDPEVIKVASLYLRIIPITYAFMGISMSVGGAFNGMGQPAPAFTMTMVRMVALFWPLSIIGTNLFGYVGVFWAVVVANVVVGTGTFVWVKPKILEMNGGTLNYLDVEPAVAYTKQE